MRYHGIDLTPPEGPVQFTHSHSADMIIGKSSDLNIDWTERFFDVPWGDVKAHFPQVFEDASRLNSLINMNYQVCNGGIAQYFYNGYDKSREPYSQHDVAQLDLEEQKKDFEALREFACAIYPERTEENEALSLACKAFQALSYEEDAPVIETVYCEEDEYIDDPDYPGEKIQNPDYFEPYDETNYENVIHGEDAFESAFFKDLSSGSCASAYLEELFELRSQYLFKSFIREMEERAPANPNIGALLSSIQEKGPSLEQRITSAEKQTLLMKDPPERETKDFGRS